MKKLIITIVTLFFVGGNVWGQIKLGQDIDGEAAGDMSGHSISLSPDGNRLAIGAPNNDGNGVDAGHVRVYEWQGGGWTQMGSDIDGEAASDRSGYSVSFSADGSRLAIGAPYNGGAGHVRVYEWKGGAWTQMGADIEGWRGGDRFGWSVSLSGNGNILVIGAPFFDSAPSATDNGYVSIYEWQGGAWITGGLGLMVGLEGDQKGNSVSLSADGNRMALGAPGYDGRSGGILQCWFCTSIFAEEAGFLGKGRLRYRGVVKR